MSTTVSTIPCLICEAPNAEQALICSSCQAPMSLYHHAARLGGLPQIISILGDSNVGKTVYLGVLLDMLAKQSSEIEAIPRGVNSVDLQERVTTHLASRRFPPKTPMEPDQWYWAYYQVTRKQRRPRVYDLVMLDMAGEALAAEMDQPQTYNVILNLLYKSAGCMLLVDAELAAAGSPHPDFFGVKVANYLDALTDTRKRRKVESPLAVVLCKADTCPDCFEDPAGFARTNLHRLWALTQARFARVAFFACGIVGCLGWVNDEAGHRINIPLYTAPRGVIEPFEWITQQLQ